MRDLVCTVLTMEILLSPEIRRYVFRSTEISGECAITCLRFIYLMKDVVGFCQVTCIVRRNTATLFAEFFVLEMLQ